MEFWRSHFDRRFRQRHKKGGEGICLISGEFGPIAVTHESIKGASSLGGQASGVSLMSFDKRAFRSYGWEKNANSPVSIKWAAAYVLALNDLMRKGKHRAGRSPDTVLRTRTDYGGAAFLYWTRRPSDLDLFGLVENPDPEQVARLLRRPESGERRREEAVDPNDFYLLAVGATGARLVIRDWFWESLEKARANLAGWVQELRITDFWEQGRISKAPPMWRLLKAISPPGEKPDSKRNA
ncbi:MAG: type I-C CRISPR-associated protein Cas8c/Csd1, partial [Acidobacteriota bacterium]